MFEDIPYNVNELLDGYRLSDYPSSVVFIGKGLKAIENTVAKMIQIIKESSRNLRIRDKAADIVRESGTAPKDQYGEVDAIYNWVRDHTHYLRDIQGLETLQSPLLALDMIEKGYAFDGDCDDLTMLTLSLIKSIGYPVKVRIAAYKGKDKFSHVYGLVYMYGEWIPIEPIRLGVPLGWEAPNAINTKDYEVGKD